MATLITVHGTNDTGPEDGDKWWQRGGPLEEDIRRLVTSDDGPVIFTVHTWHARNSEAGRYEAAKALEERLDGLEKAGEKYCLVSHSHGGSVIAHMLGSVHEKGRELANMTRWVTVGTPFVHVQRRPLLFSRLTTPGVAAMMIVIYLLLMWGAFVWSSFHLVFITREGLNRPPIDIMLLVLAPLFIAALYLGLRHLQPPKLRMSDARSRAGRAQKFASRWLGLWHSDDEVINGGRVLKDVQFKPFRSEFASPLFAFLSLLLFPLLIWAAAHLNLYSVLSPHLTAWDPKFEAADSPDPFKLFARQSFAIVCLPAVPIFKLLPAIGLAPEQHREIGGLVIGTTLVVGAAIGFAILWLLAIVMHRLVLVSSRAISAGLSSVLNDLTRTQVVALGYGSDSQGEFAIGAHPKPAWITYGYPHLPDALEEEITRASDAAASKTLSRLRQSLSTLDFGAGEPGDVLTRHVTWSELVHTIYFHVPRLRKLVAYIVAQQDGFKPTEEFRRDPEYALMGEWLAQIQAGRAPSA